LTDPLQHVLLASNLIVNSPDEVFVTFNLDDLSRKEVPQGAMGLEIFRLVVSSWENEIHH
jgi:hypothetical protein